METMDNKKVWVYAYESGQHRGKEIARNAYISDLTPQEVYTTYCDEDGIIFATLDDFDGYSVEEIKQNDKRYHIFSTLLGNENLEYLVIRTPELEVLEYLEYDDIYTSVVHDCKRLYLVELDEEGNVLQKVDGKRINFDW